MIALCIASAVMGLTLLTPALPLIKGDTGASSEAVQQLLTVYMIALALGQLIYGPVSDRTGRRPVLLFGALLYGGGGFFSLLTDDIVMLTAWRAVQGMGAAACISMGRAIVNDSFERTEAARKMSTISMILAIAPSSALAFGGVLVQSAGWRSTLVLISFCGFAVFVLALYLVKETNLHRLQVINIKSVLSAYLTLLRKKVFFFWAMASGLQVGIFFTMNGIMPFQYQRLGYSPAEFGLWFSLTSISYMVGNSINARYLVHKGIERIALAGCCLAVIATGLVFTTQALGFTHALSLALPCALFGFSNGIIFANSTIGAISAAGKHAGTASGLVGAWQMASGGIAGAIIVALGGASNFLVGAAGLVIMALGSAASMLLVFLSDRANHQA